jgi:hypothetical protein
MAKVKPNDKLTVELDADDTPLRISTIIEQEGVNPLEAAAVMTEHGLKVSDRIGAGRFLQMVADWKSNPAGRR